MYILTKCGHKIVISDQTQRHLRAHPGVWSFLPEAINRVTLPTDRSKLAVEVHMGRITGRSGCIETSAITTDEPTTFALRSNRLAPSRVAIGATGPVIRHVTIIATPSDLPGIYNLLTAYVGDLAPKEPWDPSVSDMELLASLAFWTTHALVYDPAVMGPVIESTWREICQAAAKHSDISP